jgi:hypothetical protein
MRTTRSKTEGANLFGQPDDDHGCPACYAAFLEAVGVAEDIRAAQGVTSPETNARAAHAMLNMLEAILKDGKAYDRPVDIVSCYVPSAATPDVDYDEDPFGGDPWS